MIVKEYYQNIDCYHPKNYFEKWYADLWRRRIGKRNATSALVDHVVEEELEKVGARVVGKDNGSRFVVTFKNDVDYTAFVLRWA